MTESFTIFGHGTVLCYCMALYITLVSTVVLDFYKKIKANLYIMVSTNIHASVPLYIFPSQRHPS